VFDIYEEAGSGFSDHVCGVMSLAEEKTVKTEILS